MSSADADIGAVRFAPLREESTVELPTMSLTDGVMLRSFSKDEDGRTRHTLIPARNVKPVHTGLIMTVPPLLHPLLITPEPLWSAQMECIVCRVDAESGELLVCIQSYRHDSFHIPHGTWIASLMFLQAVAPKYEGLRT